MTSKIVERPNCALHLHNNTLVLFNLETGEVASLSLQDSNLSTLLNGKKPLLCFAPHILEQVKNACNVSFSYYFDILELHGFLFPTAFISPTLQGVCNFYKIKYKHNELKDVVSLYTAYNKMLSFVVKSQDNTIEKIARHMLKDNWAFAPILLNELNASFKQTKQDSSALEVWNNLKKVEINTLREDFAFNPLSAKQSEQSIENILTANNHGKRQKQDFYIKETLPIFQEFNESGINAVLAQAETGTGKTIAYLANAIEFAKGSNFPVIFSTYTIVLQNQIVKQMQELASKGIIKKDDIVVRKGRENYVCLLNYKTILDTRFKKSSIASGFLARWLLYTKDGDFKNGDFISWLKTLIDNNIIYGVTDQEGQCIAKACPFYNKCYIEHVKNKSLKAKYLIVNHATLLSNLESIGKLSKIYIVDEAHHLLATADSILSDSLSIKNSLFLQKWLFGSNDLFANNKVGLEFRFKDILTDKDLEKVNELKEVFAEFLPSTFDANLLLKQGSIKGRNNTILDNFFISLFEYIVSFNKDHKQSFYSMQSSLGFNIENSFKEDIENVFNCLNKACLIIESLNASVEHTKDEIKSLIESVYSQREGDAKKKLEDDVFKCSSLILGFTKCLNTLSLWRSMLKSCFVEQDKSLEDKKHYSFFGLIEKENGVIKDISVNRVFKDPGFALANSMFLGNYKNFLLTSATLKSPLQHESSLIAKYGLNNDEFIKTKQFFIDSDFNYKENSLVLIINDFNKASSVLEKTYAIKDLITASNGGALALFTSISRLKQSYEILSKLLQGDNLSVLAQHVNKQELYSLLQMFKEDTNSTLLGTDAIRDGIDIPGNSLRMLIYEKVPWQTKTVLLKDRKELFGKTYEDNIVCSHLKQAFGRLIRNKNDKGVFVMLDSSFPSKYKASFPKGVQIKHVSLADAVLAVNSFFGKP